MEPVYYGHLGTNKRCLNSRCPDIYIIIMIKHDLIFETITKCVDYVGVLIYKYPD